jgi:hypothetical protein
MFNIDSLGVWILVILLGVIAAIAILVELAGEIVLWIKGPGKGALPFAPRVGDHVDFASDRQTEKGPSAGSVVIVSDNQVAIRHSDCVEWFEADKVRVVRYSSCNRNLRQPAADWTLA